MLLPWAKLLFLQKNADFFQKIPKKQTDISKNKGVRILKGIPSKTTYVSVLTCQIPSL